MDALRDGRKMRKRIFDSIAQRHAHDFGNGGSGLKFYEDLLSAVHDSGVPEAAQEFERRFFPLVMTDQDLTRGQEAQRSPRWGWICVAAVVVGGLGFGFSLFKMATAEPPTMANAPTPTNPAEPEIEKPMQPVTAPKEKPSSP